MSFFIVVLSLCDFSGVLCFPPFIPFAHKAFTAVLEVEQRWSTFQPTSVSVSNTRLCILMSLCIYRAVLRGGSIIRYRGSPVQLPVMQTFNLWNEIINTIWIGQALPPGLVQYCCRIVHTHTNYSMTILSEHPLIGNMSWDQTFVSCETSFTLLMVCCQQSCSVLRNYLLH